MLKRSATIIPNEQLDDGLEESNEHLPMKNKIMNWKYDILSSDESIEDVFIKKENFNSIPEDILQIGNYTSLPVDTDDVSHLELTEEELEGVFNESDGFSYDSHDEIENIGSNFALNPVISDKPDHDNNPVLENDFDFSIESIENDSDPTADQNFFEENDEGPIALSDEELDNALNDTIDLPAEEPVAIENNIDDEISLDKDDDFDFSIDTIDANNDGKKSEIDLTTSDDSDLTTDQTFFEENDEGPIALSDEELDNALNDTIDLPSEEETTTIENKIDLDNETSVHDDFDFSFETDEKNTHLDETVPAPKKDEPFAEPFKDPFGSEIDLTTNDDSDLTTDQTFFEENDEGPIALSDEELDNALNDTINLPPEKPSTIENNIDDEISLDKEDDDFDFSIDAIDTNNDEKKSEIDVTTNDDSDLATDQTFFEENDEGPIALSDEELDNALNDTINLPAEEPSTIENNIDDEISLDKEDDDFDFSIDAIDANNDEKKSQMDATTNDDSDLTTDQTFFEENDEGPIALSDEELDNALNDTINLPAEEPSTIENNIDDEISLDKEDDDFDFSIDAIDANNDEKKSQMDATTNDDSDLATDQTFFEENDEGPIALSDEELDNALNDTIDLPAEEPSTIENNIDNEISLDKEEDDDFDFSIDAIDANNDEKKSEMDATTNDDSDLTTDQTFFEENDEGPIALSDEELDNALMESETIKQPEEANEVETEDEFDENLEIPVFNDEIEEEAEMQNSTEDNIHSKNEITDFDKNMNEESQNTSLDEDNDWEIELTPDDYKATSVLKKDLPVKSLHKSNDTSEIISDEEGKVNFHEESNVSLPNRDELKKVVAYLDNLLGELPDEMIEKFAKSEYFKLYQKVMEDLGL